MIVALSRFLGWSGDSQAEALPPLTVSGLRLRDDVRHEAGEVHHPPSIDPNGNMKWQRRRMRRKRRRRKRRRKMKKRKKRKKRRSRGRKRRSGKGVTLTLSINKYFTSSRS